MITKETDFKKHIKSGEFNNLYFIAGEEKFLVKHYTDRLIKEIMGEEPPV